MCLTTYADSLERWPVGVDAACVLLVSLALFFNRVRQVILNLLEKGGHAHVRTAAAATLSQLVVAKRNDRFLQRLPLCASSMRAWTRRDPPGPTPRPNTEDPPPKLSLAEGLARLLACMNRSKTGRSQLQQPHAVLTLLHFLGVDSQRARDICVTTLASMIVQNPHHMCTLLAGACTSLRWLHVIARRDPIFAKRAAACVACALSFHAPASWPLHKELASITFTLWSIAVDTQTKMDSGKEELAADELVRPCIVAPSQWFVCWCVPCPLSRAGMWLAHTPPCLLLFRSSNSCRRVRWANTASMSRRPCGGHRGACTRRARRFA